jgi:hypothetical protein
MKLTKYQRDLTERIVRSFLGGLLAAATLSLQSGNIDSAEAFAMAAVCGGVSAVLGLLSKNLGSPDSAGTVD